MRFNSFIAILFFSSALNELAGLTVALYQVVLRCEESFKDYNLNENGDCQEGMIGKIATHKKKMMLTPSPMIDVKYAAGCKRVIPLLH